MSNSMRVFIKGVTIMYGDCLDPQHQGMRFVSIGTNLDHTTYIVAPNYATASEIQARGADADAWRMVAVEVTTGYWD